MKKFKIYKYKSFWIILIIMIIAFKNYQYFRHRDLISIIDKSNIVGSQKVIIRRSDMRDSIHYNFDIDNKNDIEKIIQLIKSIEVRRYSSGPSGIRYNGCENSIVFENKDNIINMDIIGNNHVSIRSYPDDFDYNTYKIIGNIDASCLDDIIEKKTKYIENKSDSSFNLYDIYAVDRDGYWDYKLSDGTHMYKNLGFKEIKDNKIKVNMRYVKDNIDKRGKYIDRIKEKEIEIISSQLIIDDTMVLKTPLKKGNTWQTKVKLNIGGVEEIYDATVTIEEVTKKIVKTSLVVSDLKKFKNKEYIRTQIYQKNFGLIYEKYNDKNGLNHEVRLDKVYKYSLREFIDPREYMKLNDLEVIEDDFNYIEK
ncbi:hypothetical protein [Dethiothermospora halolimnae]|uniref:hypothetical protein n=1 Tax=Dethiothermospora halolimnae TaxID=3114390 RepID=UPI003CCBA640